MKEKNKKFTTRFLALALCLVTVLTIVPAMRANAAAPYHNGGLGIARTQQTVWTDTSTNTRVGSIYAHEGFTILENWGSAYVRVEYSTSSGTKTGYIVNPNIWTDSNSCVASVNTSSNVYYGQEGAYLYRKVGAVSAGEDVVVLASQAGWDYIEYNTTSGRKRAYIEHSKLTWRNNPATVRDLPCNEHYPDKYINVSNGTTVYAGPSEQYFRVGTVSTSDNPLYYCWEFSQFGSTYVYVEYEVDGSNIKKSGFIKIS